jgi:hypothetical protein
VLSALPLRRALAALNLVLSLLLIGAYVARERGTSRTEVEQSLLAQAVPVSGLYVVERGGRAVGYNRLSIEPVGDEAALRVTEEAEMRLPVPGGSYQHAKQHSTQLLDASLRLQQWSFTVVAGEPGGAQQSTTLEGERPHPLSDSMIVRIHTGESERRITMYAGADVVMGSGAWARILYAGRLKEGARVALREFDPTSVALRALDVEIGERRSVSADSARASDDPLYGTSEGAMRVYQVKQTVGGLTYQLWVGENGLPVRVNLPLGMSARPAAAHEVVALAERWTDGALATAEADEVDEGATLIGESAIAAGVQVRGARELGWMRVHATGVPLPAGADGGVQRVQGDTIEIRRLSLPPRGRAGYVLPLTPESALYAQHPDLAGTLSTEPFIETDHPEIVQTAERVLGGTTDPGEATRRIGAFVHRHLEKKYTASLPSAIEALRGAAGDCNEHTMLTVALLRAAGVPARPVSGLAYLDGSFYFHAWAEAWFDGRWVPLDPTFGETPADPARVRLFVGREQINAVLPMVGTLQLDVVGSGAGVP